MPNLPITAKTNKQGHLEVGGCDVTALAAEFGTPLYVMDEKTIRERCRQYKTSFKKFYPNTEVVYACKALCTTGVLEIINDEGLGVDVVSGGELLTAVKAGCNKKKIYFHGNNKSREEIEQGLKAGVGRFVVDNLEEIKSIDEISQRSGIRADVLIRINPGIEAHTHEFIKTGQIDSKFGIGRERVLDAVSMILSAKNMNFVGLHAHIGSQIFDVKSFAAELDVVLDMAKEIAGKRKVPVEEIDIGGGLGVDYFEKSEAPAIDAFAKAVGTRMEERSKDPDIGEPKLIIEPGRSIVGHAGITIYTIGCVKDIPGIRKYVIVDGGMADNPRPILYQARYDALLGNKAKLQKTEKVTIAGRFCESGDVLVKDAYLQKPEVGDTLVMLCTGAYNYSMASNYNRFPRPAMVLVADGSASLIVGRETHEDVLSKDVIG